MKIKKIQQVFVFLVVGVAFFAPLISATPVFGQTDFEREVLRSQGLDDSIPADSETRAALEAQGARFGNTSTTQSGTIRTIGALIIALTNILNTLLVFLVGLAVFFIIWGILGYVRNAGSEEKRKEARAFIVFGLVAVFVMISIWGLLNILANSFRFDNAPTAYTPPIAAPSNVPATPTNIPQLLDKIGAVFAGLAPFLLGLAAFFVVVGIAGYIRHGGNEEKVREARSFIIWGLVSLFVMISIWGLVNILVGTFNIDNTVNPNQLPKLPEVPTR